MWDANQIGWSGKTNVPQELKKSPAILGLWQRRGGWGWGDY